ncbi:ABC transporter permease [candidate division KSB1 bacterium]|nr:ABC transporter permease [candidate division KSB1 bacterium]
MFFNTLKFAFRNLRKNALYSFINIIGLAIGLAAIMLIVFWVRDELSYDNFHANAERIYRVERAWNFKEMVGQAPIAAAPWGPGLLANYPEIEQSVRISKEETFVRNQENQSFKQNIIAADETLFSLFDFSLINGDENTALIEPNQVVLTPELAVKYCGTTNAIGKSLSIDWLGERTDFEITGILSPVPANSHMHFDMVISFSSYPDELLTDWMSGGFYNFILVDENTDAETLEAKFPMFLKHHATTDFMTYFGSDLNITDVFQIKLRPLTSIHLQPSRHFEFEPQGQLTTVRMFTIAAFMILLIACFNFINLSTAQAHKRAKEVGMRKAVGAKKGQLVLHFLGESILVTFLALGLALVIVRLSMPIFNAISGKSLSGAIIFSEHNLVVLVALSIITGFLAGLYPALFLSAFEPLKIFHGMHNAGAHKSRFRKILSTAQFAISIFLIIGALTVSKQLFYIQNKSLGFDKENVIVLPAQSKAVRADFEAFRSELSKESRILSVASSSFLPGQKTPPDANFRRADTEDIHNLCILQTDFYFSEALNFEILHGRTFSKEFSTDSTAFVLNERAVQTLGFKLDETVGKKLSMIIDGTHDVRGTIIGVIKDFHFMSLHSNMQSYALFLPKENDIQFISIRIAPGAIKEILASIENTWRSIYPNEQFEYTFLDDRINQLYTKDQQTRQLFFIFAGLAIFVACLGLFGLATFNTEQRTKEIGVRKVLGSSMPRISFLLVKEFLVWIILANIFAWPIAWFTMKNWLQDFAFRTSMRWEMFIFAGLVTLGIALLTITLKILKAARANPVEALRYE